MNQADDYDKVLPAPSVFKTQNGTQWTLEYEGDLQFTQTLQADGLGGDKCRTGKIGGKVIWSCGDMMCSSSKPCGFSMGPAFYGEPNSMVVNTDGITNVGDYNFATAWSGDPKPVAPQTAYGMDTSNVAPINSTHGVAYVWEITRGDPAGTISDKGPGVVSVTLGQNRPIATRIGPLLGGPSSIQLGLLAIMSARGYIFTYSIGGPSNIIVGRVKANDDVFDASKYEYLSAADHKTWIKPGAVPDSSSASKYGMQTANPSGSFGCAVYGSVFFSDYLGKYVILCNIYEYWVNMYVADTPHGPWSAEYGIQGGVMGYGSMAHPEFGTNPLYFSIGPDGPFHMYKLTLKY